MRNKKAEDVLMMVVVRDATIQRLFENSFALAFAKEGKQTFTGNTIEAVKDTVNYDTILRATEST